jgi:hypothetical protein
MDGRRVCLRAAPRFDTAFRWLDVNHQVFQYRSRVSHRVIVSARPLSFADMGPFAKPAARLIGMAIADERKAIAE